MMQMIIRMIATIRMKIGRSHLSEFCDNERDEVLEIMICDHFRSMVLDIVREIGIDIDAVIVSSFSKSVFLKR